VCRCNCATDSEVTAYEMILCNIILFRLSDNASGESDYRFVKDLRIGKEIIIVCLEYMNVCLFQNE